MNSLMQTRTAGDPDDETIVFTDLTPTKLEQELHRLGTPASDDVIRQWMEDHFSISANNSATRPSRWGSFSIRPDGQILGKLRRHQTGLLLTEMKIDPQLFDAPGPWREAAMNGQLHSGTIVDDPRSNDVTCL